MSLEETTDLMYLAKTYEVWNLLRVSASYSFDSNLPKVLEWYMYISLGTDTWFHILKLVSYLHL